MKNKYILYGVDNFNERFVINISDKLEEIDEFTENFIDVKDIKDELNRAYNTDVNLKKLLLIQDDSKKEKSLSIKFIEDSYDELSVIEQYAKYLWDDPKRIYNSKIKYVKLDFMVKYLQYGKLDFSKHDIEKAVYAYFYRNGKFIYDKVRSAYFEMKKEGQVERCLRK